MMRARDEARKIGSDCHAKKGRAGLAVCKRVSRAC